MSLLSRSSTPPSSALRPLTRPPSSMPRAPTCPWPLNEEPSSALRPRDIAPSSALLPRPSPLLRLRLSSPWLLLWKWHNLFTELLTTITLYQPGRRCRLTRREVWESRSKEDSPAPQVLLASSRFGYDAFSWDPDVLNLLVIFVIICAATWFGVRVQREVQHRALWVVLRQAASEQHPRQLVNNICPPLHPILTMAPLLMDDYDNDMVLTVKLSKITSFPLPRRPGL